MTHSFPTRRSSDLSTIPDAQRRSPLRIWHAAAFQFINPKAWMMTVTAVSLYVPAAPDYWVTLAVVSATFLIVSVPSITIWAAFGAAMQRSEEHTSELQSLMRISYAVFCLKKKKLTIY